MKLVVTDGATLSGGGVSLDGFRRFGELVVYDLTAPEQLAERVRTRPHQKYCYSS